jgi:hypothetical protein
LSGWEHGKPRKVVLRAMVVLAATFTVLVLVVAARGCVPGAGGFRESDGGG